MNRNLKAQYDSKATRIVATTRDVDRDGEVVDPQGVRNFGAYLSRNPVILWQHKHDQAPVGKAIGGEVKDDRIELDIEWAPTPMGREVRALYDGGFMTSFSIGFIPTKSENKAGQFTWTDWELLEVSAVSIPANPLATVIRSAEARGLALPTLKGFAGKSGSDNDQDIIKMLDEIEKKETTMNTNISTEAMEAARKQIEAEYKAQAEAAQREAEKKELTQLREKLAEVYAKAQIEEPGSYSSMGSLGAPQEYKGVDLAFAQRKFVERMDDKGNREAAKMADKPVTRELLKAFVDFSKAEGNPHTKDMLEGTPTAGGYLTPTVTHELMHYARQNSVALRRASIRNMRSDIEHQPVENAKVTLTHNNEATEAVETSATFTQVTLTAGDLDGYADVSMHLEMDSSTPIAVVLLEQFTEAYGQKIDSAVFASAGDPVSGIFSSYGRSEVFSAGSTSFSEVLASNLINAIGKLEKPRRNGAAWFGGRETLWQYIMTLEDGNNKPYMAQDFTGAVAGRMLGYDVEETEYAPDDAADTAMLIFGNLSGFLIGNRLSNLTLFRDPYSLSAQHFVRYVFWTRVAYANALPNNLVAIKTAA